MKLKKRLRMTLDEIEKEMELLTLEEQEQARGGGGDERPWDLNGDGCLSLDEANNWFRNGNGTPIIVPASCVDLGFVNSSQWQVGQVDTVQILGKNSDGFIYGKVDIKYEGNNEFSIIPDTYDFNMEKDQNGNTEYSFRNFATYIGSKVAGKGKSYDINFEGTTKGRISYGEDIKINEDMPPSGYKW